MEKVYKKEFTTKQLLKNASGLRKLERTYLDYSQAIIHSLSFDTSIISPLLRNLNMSEEELFQRLSGVFLLILVFLIKVLVSSINIWMKKMIIRLNSKIFSYFFYGIKGYC